VLYGPFKLECLYFSAKPGDQADVLPASAFARGVFGSAAYLAVVLAEAARGVGRDADVGELSV
tara:strand:- start:723 stop:911 length:189 start_codon:yes stop_codon:yes gene_type:complete